MRTLHEALSSDSALVEYVEHELESALGGLPVAWRLSDTRLAVERAVTQAKWMFAKSEKDALAWRIYSPLSDNVELYYDLRVSRDLGMFVLTHSNLRAGLYDARWLLRKATLIPFGCLTDKRSLSSRALASRKIAFGDLSGLSTESGLAHVDTRPNKRLHPAATARRRADGNTESGRRG